MKTESFVSFHPEHLSTPDLHQYLLGAIAPRPIAFASTISADGDVNLSPFSFFNVFSSRPPIMIFSPARSGRDNSTKNTYDNVLEVPEVVINVVTYNMVEQMNLASAAFAREINEFDKSGFTPHPSLQISPPRVAESPVAFECKVIDVKALGTLGGAGNLIICEVLVFHIQDEYLTGEGQIDIPKLDLVGRMGANYYCRTNKSALFTVDKPGWPVAIGIDSLPLQVRESKILTGNQLGKLGGLTHLPTSDEIEKIKSTQIYLSLSSIRGQLTVEQIHERAAELVDKENIKEALSLLMAFEDM